MLKHMIKYEERIKQKDCYHSLRTDDFHLHISFV